MTRDIAPFFRSTGKSLIPAEKEAEGLLASVGPGSLVRVKITKPRRVKHHRFFFATIANYFENWPVQHSFVPENEEHLRAWATCKAKYYTILGERLHQNDGDALRMADFVEKAMRLNRKKYSFVTIHNGSIVLLTPRSVDWETLDEMAFRPIADSILEVLASESGIPVSTMMAENAA